MSFSGEEVLVDLLDRHRLGFLDSAVVGDHEFPETAAVDQGDP
jgi:hypothetical protein